MTGQQDKGNNEMVNKKKRRMSLEDIARLKNEGDRGSSSTTSGAMKGFWVKNPRDAEGSDGCAALVVEDDSETGEGGCERERLERQLEIAARRERELRAARWDAEREGEEAIRLLAAEKDEVVRCAEARRATSDELTEASGVASALRHQLKRHCGGRRCPKR
eukprot:GHVU01033567.1.p1 GENE.GHVU01033567.1~~GHVU01033567.1.p1  ORF type:complete len:162 (-),score=33.00 GHVU01033567.1:156-641(-)